MIFYCDRRLISELGRYRAAFAQALSRSGINDTVTQHNASART